MQEVNLERAFICGGLRIVGDAEHGGALAHHDEVGMANVEGSSRGQDHTKWGERLAPCRVVKFGLCHLSFLHRM